MISAIAHAVLASVAFSDAAIVLSIDPPINFSGVDLTEIEFEYSLFNGSGVVAVYGRIGDNPLSGSCLVSNEGIGCDLRFQAITILISADLNLDGIARFCEMSIPKCVSTSRVKKE